MTELIVTRQEIERRGPVGHQQQGGREAQTGQEEEDEWEDEEDESEDEEYDELEAEQKETPSPSPSPSKASTIKVGSPSAIAAGEGQNIHYSPASPEIRIYEDLPNYMPGARPRFRGPSGDYVGKENDDPDEEEEDTEEEPPAYDPEDDEIRYAAEEDE